MQGKTLTADQKAAKITEIRKAYEQRDPVFEREMLKFFMKEFADLPADQKFAPLEEMFKGMDAKQRRASEEQHVAMMNGPLLDPEQVAAIYGMSRADIESHLGIVADFIKESRR